MAAPSGKFYGVGLRHARVYILDANGIPDASATTAYVGIQTVGAKAYELTIPDVRRIAHTGDDHVLAQDVLPRLEPSSGTLRVARMDFAAYAALSGTLEATVGESKIVGYGTSEQGSEPSICALLYQQVIDAVSNTRKYSGYILPSSKAIINPPSLNENAPEFTVSLLPSAASKTPWGVALTAVLNGFTTAELLAFETDGEPMIATWEADGSATEFLFPTAMQAASTAKIHAITTTTTAGVTSDVTTTATKATDKITIAGPLTAGIKVAAWYEIA